MGEQITYVDGKYFRENEAFISVMDHGFLYGDGVFEALRAYKGKVFQFDDHMDRLYDSARIIDLHIPLSKEEFKNVVIETVKKSGYKDCYIRPQVTRGIGLLGADTSSCKKPTVIVYVTQPPSMKKQHSLRTIISTYRRPPAFVLPPESKMTQYLNNILAKIEAKAKGADDAIFLDYQGFVSEGSSWNIFIVKNNCLITPSVTSSILKGITRKVVINIANELNIKVEERNVVLSELFTSDEIFGTATGTEISPIIEINGRIVGKGNPGSITNKIEEKFRDVVEKNGTPVYAEN